MYENIHEPFVHPNSEREFSENTHIGLPEFGVSSLFGGPRGFITFQPNTECTTNNNMLAPTQTQTPAPTPIPTIPTLAEEVNEEAVAPPLSKKRKGRPPGSKNKEKRPIFTGNVEKTTQKIYIEAGNDVIESLIKYANYHNVSMTVLNAFGHVSNVTLLNHVSHLPAVPLIGCFDMFLMEGTYYNPNCEPVPPQLITNPACSCFSIHLSCPEGSTFCGAIGGNLMAESQVIVIATLFKKLSFFETEHNNEHNNENNNVCNSQTLS